MLHPSSAYMEFLQLYAAMADKQRDHMTTDLIMRLLVLCLWYESKSKLMGEEYQ